jgi:hypothetical protein
MYRACTIYGGITMPNIDPAVMTRMEIETEIDNARTLAYFAARGTVKLDHDELQELRDLMDELHTAIATGQYQPEGGVAYGTA